MASKYELITERYLNTAGEIAKPEVWPSFLTTACHNFRLSFDKQVLLYAQRPDATAVLPIEGKHGWNQKFGRWVNRGSKGIALFDSDRNGVATLKYYFDISDTHEGRYPRPVPIWSVRPEFEQDILETLENSFGDLQAKDTLASGLVSAAQNACTDLQGSEPVQLGQYRGFSLSLQYIAANTDYKLTIKGAMSHTISLGADIYGNITRMDNVVDGLAKELEAYRAVLQDTQTQLANAKVEMETPFAREKELAEKSARLKELNILLNIDQKDPVFLNDTPYEAMLDNNQRIKVQKHDLDR